MGSYINQFRGVKKGHKLYAKESSLSEECTTKLTPYPFEGNKNLKMWDLPGANTKAFPLKTYSTATKMDLYDAFIMLTVNRFTETDIEVYKQIEKTGKPC